VNVFHAVISVHDPVPGSRIVTGRGGASGGIWILPLSILFLKIKMRKRFKTSHFGNEMIFWSVPKNPRL